MEKLVNELVKIRTDISELKKLFDTYEQSQYFGNWIPRKKLMEFLEYGDTKMAALFKTGELKISTIGNRKFIYKPSVLKFLEKNAKIS